MNTVQSLIRNTTLHTIWNLHKKLIIAFLLIIGLFGFGQLAVGNFFSLPQVLLTIKLASFIALFGLCQMFVISAGGDGLDLSVGYMATMTAVFTASIMDGKNENLWMAVLVALGVGIAVGLVNGFLSAYIKLPPLVVTLAMANILQGIINAYTAGVAITGKPSPILEIIAAKYSWIFPNVVFVLIVVAVVTMIIFYKTSWGRKVFGVGANETAAFLSGVDVKRVRLISFVCSSVLASLLGLLLVGNLGIAFKDMGSNYVMPSIAAAIVGGVSLAGGDGNYVGVILGAIFLQTLTNLLVAFGWGDAGKWLGFGLVLFSLLIVYVRNQRSR
jgi:ribose transport system permease protein